MTTTGATRYLSLDWARGLMMVATLLTVALLPPRPAQLVHAEWLDPTALDLIFPVFVLLSGVGLAFANRGRVRWRDTLRRSLTLLPAGWPTTRSPRARSTWPPGGSLGR